jgi:hypothetical protein
MSNIILRGRWCHIIVLNVHAPTEDKTDDVKESFYEELERVFDKCPKYHTKILLGDFNAKVCREDFFLNLQLGMKVCTKFVIIMELDQQVLATFKNFKVKVRYSHIATSITIFLPFGVASCCASIQLVPYDAVNRNKISIRQLTLYFPYHSLHVSAPTGHLQVRYTIRCS